MLIDVGVGWCEGMWLRYSTSMLFIELSNDAYSKRVHFLWRLFTTLALLLSYIEVPQGSANNAMRNFSPL